MEGSIKAARHTWRLIADLMKFGDGLQPGSAGPVEPLSLLHGDVQAGRCRSTSCGGPNRTDPTTALAPVGGWHRHSSFGIISSRAIFIFERARGRRRPGQLADGARSASLMSPRRRDVLK